jgi:hypothetical protein
MAVKKKADHASVTGKHNKEACNMCQRWVELSFRSNITPEYNEISTLITCSVTKMCMFRQMPFALNKLLLSNKLGDPHVKQFDCRAFHRVPKIQSTFYQSDFRYMVLFNTLQRACMCAWVFSHTNANTHCVIYNFPKNNNWITWHMQPNVGTICMGCMYLLSHNNENSTARHKVIIITTCRVQGSSSTFNKTINPRALSLKFNQNSSTGKCS